MESTILLKFSDGKSNAKLQQLGGRLYTFSLPSGYSCPFAKDCLSKAIKKDDGSFTIEDGKHTQFRCFSAHQEVLYPATRNQRQHNFDLLNSMKGTDEMVRLIKLSIPAKATIIRVHVGGDFYSKEYFRAWMMVAAEMPNITFYAYTKSIGYWVVLKDIIPANFKLNASKGGTHDHLIEKNNLKYAEVVYSEQEAIDKGLEIDHDDSHAFLKDKSFALLLHGVQPKGSKASAARQLLLKQDIGQYNREKIKEGMAIAA